MSAIDPEFVEKMTPKEHVLESLKNIVKAIREAPCLNSEREKLAHSMDNVISWESQRLSVNEPR